MENTFLVTHSTIKPLIKAKDCKNVFCSESSRPF